MGKYDFSAEKELPVYKAIDPLVTKESIEEKVDMKLAQVQDKIKIIEDVKANPVKPGYAQEEIDPEKYVVDLNDLLNAQLSDCPGTVIPMLIDHAVSVALGKRDSYKVERRKLDFKYWWVIFLGIGIACMFLIANMLFG